MSEDGGRRIGEVLERRRLERGLSLEEVEEATRIRTRYLEGLEREDYSFLPDEVYVRGFLKTYADYLGLDGAGLARELKERRASRRERQAGGHERPRTRSELERPILQPGGVAGTRRRGVSGATVATIVVVLILLTVVLGMLYRVGRGPTVASEGPPADAPAREAVASREPDGDRGGGREASGRASGTTQGGTSGVVSPSSSQGTTVVAEPQVLRATVRVNEDGPSWISVSTDGEIAYAQVAPVGFRQTFTAREVFGITTYNAAGVELEINGQRVGTLGQYGEFVEREFPLQRPVE
jgi:cytoskeletal protein RodZ